MAIPLYSRSNNNYLDIDKLYKSIAAQLTVKYTVSAAHNTTNINFFNTAALYGASNFITANNTWATICDLTGSGDLCNVVGPAFITNSNDTKIIEIRITKDGIESVYTFNSTTGTNSGKRPLLGVVGSGSLANGDYTSAFDINGTQDYFKPVFSGLIEHPVGTVSLIPRYWFRMLNLPRLRFESSLKVEVRSNDYSTSSNAHYAAAIYHLD